MQSSIQGLNCEDPERKDLLMDIGTEELRRTLYVRWHRRSRGKCGAERRDCLGFGPLAPPGRPRAFKQQDSNQGAQSSRRHGRL